MVLNQEEIDGCREAFLAFDKDRSGTIDAWELRQVLEAMGEAPTEDELFQVSNVHIPSVVFIPNVSIPKEIKNGTYNFIPTLIIMIDD